MLIAVSFGKLQDIEHILLGNQLSQLRICGRGETSNVVQFSVYSAQPRPQYSPPAQTEKKKYLFSVDYQGNAHYINEDEVSALLRTPQAMKVILQLRT